jgi:hypothetical protein
MTTGHAPPRPPAPAGQARQHLAAIAASLTPHGLTSRLAMIGPVPVLTINDPAAGPHAATIAVDPDPGTATGQPFDCTCIWTSAPGTTPQATADTIRAVLHAIHPATTRPGPAPDAPARS